MKKILAVAVLAIAPVTASYADNDAGCGLGSQLMAGNEGVLYKLLATYTNGLLGNQTFGITSGTLGCNGRNKVTANAELTKFASANLDQLSAEMAAGSGEALAALASMYEVDSADRATFYTFARSNYASVFATADVTAGEVVESLTALMAKDSRLARYAI